MNLLSFQEIPRDIKEQIFFHFTIKDHSIASQVCKEWNEISDQDSFWKKIAKEILKKDIPIPSHQIKKRLKTIIANSNDEIIEKIQSFVNEVTLEKNGRFQCFIRGHQDHLHPIVFTILNQKERMEIDESQDIIENVIAINGIGEADVKNIVVTNYSEKQKINSSLETKEDIVIYKLSIGLKRKVKMIIVLPNLSGPTYKGWCFPLIKKLDQIAKEKLDELNSP